MTPEKFDPNLPAAGQQPTISPYGFILNPEKDIAKKSPLGIKDPFTQKLVMIFGGAVVLIIIALVASNLLFGSKSNVQLLVELTQTQQEIIRVNKTYATKLSSQDLKNVSANIQATTQTDQAALLGITTKSGIKTDPKTLLLKRDSATDEQITTAQSTNAVDTVFRQVLAAELLAYQQELKTAYNAEFGPATKKLLEKQFNNVTLLNEQLAQ